MADLLKENVRPTTGAPAITTALPTVADQAGDPVVVADVTIVEVAAANADRKYLEIFADTAVLNIGFGAAAAVGLTWAEIPVGGSWYTAEGVGLWGGRVLVYQNSGAPVNVPVIEY